MVTLPESVWARSLKRQSVAAPLLDSAFGEAPARASVRRVQQLRGQLSAGET